jgi:hypothetical protein
VKLVQNGGRAAVSPGSCPSRARFGLANRFTASILTTSGAALAAVSLIYRNRDVSLNLFLFSL